MSPQGLDLEQRLALCRQRPVCKQLVAPEFDPSLHKARLPNREIPCQHGSIFEREDGGIIAREGSIDVFNLLRLEGEASFAGGVFVVVRTGDAVSARAMEQMPRTCGSALNSCFRFGYFEPPMPVPVGSPPWAMKPSMTRWNTMPL